MLLPAPFSPTTATIDPAGRCRSSSSITATAVPGYRNDTRSKVMPSVSVVGAGRAESGTNSPSQRWRPRAWRTPVRTPTSWAPCCTTLLT